MATHSSILAGKFHKQRSLAGYSPWGSQRVRHNLATFTHSRILRGGGAGGTGEEPGVSTMESTLLATRSRGIVPCLRFLIPKVYVFQKKERPFLSGFLIFYFAK